MSRADRRRDEREKRHEDGRNQKIAMKALEADMSHDGIYDAKRAMSDPNYMSAVIQYTHDYKTRLEKNGITEEDLKKQFDMGYAAARKDLTVFTIKMAYAAVGLALHRRYGFGQRRIHETLGEIHDIMEFEICTDDIIAKLKEETGLELNIRDYEIGGGT